MKQYNDMTQFLSYALVITQFCDAAVEKSTVLHCNSTYTPTRSPAFSSNRLKRAGIQIFGHFVRKRTSCIFLSLFTSSELNMVESLLPECPATCMVPHLSQPNYHLNFSLFLKNFSTNLPRNSQNFFLTNPRKYVI
jgi:hypothetical protein